MVVLFGHLEQRGKVVVLDPLSAHCVHKIWVVSKNENGSDPPLGRHPIPGPVGLGRKVIYHHA